MESIAESQHHLTLQTKYNKITVTRHNEQEGISNEIRVLINIGDHFIDEKNIRSVSRFGKGTKILLNSGQEIVVDAAYEKVAAIVAKQAK